MIYSGKLINLNAGPAALPDEVLQEASAAVIDYNGIGISILSLPHRGKHFAAILEESKALVRELCELNDEYEILWLQGGGRLQFAMIPMNFLGREDTAGYIDSGNWSADAIRHALYYGKVEVLCSSKKDNYRYLPKWPTDIPLNTSYVHMTSNNTIYGTQWKEIPTIDAPLIVDMSSDIFSKPTNYYNCAIFYAVAQKNMGPAGATLVAIRKDMLQRVRRNLPPMMSFAEHVAKGSLLNTPPVFSIYVSMLVMRWIKKRGIDNIAEENKIKADLLYSEVERNSLFSNLVSREDCSLMNICFTAVGENTEQEFIAFCEENGIVNIKGHRTVGGFRASLYNAITLEDVKYIVAVMQEFELSKKQ